MKAYKYMWKIGDEPTCNRDLVTNRPLRENMILVDLYNGNRYVLQKIYKAGPKDKVLPTMPENVIQTWPIQPLPDDELARLREEMKYTSNGSSRPFLDVVFS